MRARLDSARQITVGMSIGLARRSTAPASVPESSSAPSPISIGRLLKYVYGCAFWTMTVTPRTSSPSQRTSIWGGLSR